MKISKREHKRRIEESSFFQFETDHEMLLTVLRDVYQTESYEAMMTYLNAVVSLAVDLVEGIENYLDIYDEV
jgi:hypothetical protein